MSTRILARLGEDEVDDKTRDVYGARRIGKALNRLNREFNTLFKWKSSTVEGRTRYDFEGLTRDGELVYGGGLVDLQGKTPYVSACMGESLPSKSTDPTGAGSRAGAGADVLSDPREGDNNKVSGEEWGGDDPWWLL